jgi:hypothetical protein
MNRRPVTLCGQNLGVPAHICAFFDSTDEQYDILLPYFQEGLTNGEQVVTILDRVKHPDHVARLRTAGMPVDTAVAADQLKVMASDETYTQGGVFAVERMFELLKSTLQSAQESSFGVVRTCGDMEWALASLDNTDGLMEYEARVNTLLSMYDCTLMCVYDLNRFSGRAVMDVLCTHSHIILGGEVRENPYFVPPLDFLKGLLRRGSSPLAREPS